MKYAAILLTMVSCLILAGLVIADDAAPPASAPATAPDTVPATAPATAPAAPAMSEAEATAVFNRLYATDLKKAATSGNLNDAVKLAAQMLNSAKTSAMDQPALLALLCTHAYDLGAKAPAGYPSAVEAIELLAEKVPDTRVASLDKAARIRQLAYSQALKPPARQEAATQLVEALLAWADAKLAAGDLANLSSPARRALAVAQSENLPNKNDVKNKANVFIAKEQVATRLAGLVTRLKVRPEDAATRNEIVSTYVAEFDNPGEAAKYLDPTVDASLRKLVPLAGKKPGELPEASAMELGDWYLGLSDKATEGGRQPLLVRAKGCYVQYLSLHKTKDASRTSAEMALKKLEALVPSAAGADQAADTAWIDLLKLETPGKSSGWEFKDGALTSQDQGRPIHVISVVPEGSYDLLLKFHSQFSAGDQATAIYLPVGNSACVLYFSGNWSSVADVKNKMQNETTIRPGGLTNGLKVTLEIRVTLTGESAEISVRLNDTPHLHWKGPLSELSTCPDWGKGVKSLGVGTYYARSQFDAIKLRMLTGKAKLPERADLPKGGK